MTTSDIQAEIEGIYGIQQVRKYTKARRIFSKNESLNKYVYLATIEIVEKWTKPISNEVLR